MILILGYSQSLAKEAWKDKIFLVELENYNPKCGSFTAQVLNIVGLLGYPNRKMFTVMFGTLGAYRTGLPHWEEMRLKNEPIWVVQDKYIIGRDYLRPFIPGWRSDKTKYQFVFKTAPLYKNIQRAVLCIKISYLYLYLKFRYAKV